MDYGKKEIKGNMGIQTEKFKNELIMLVNNCQLDIATAYYVLKDVLNITEKEYNKSLVREQQTAAQKQKEEN